MDYNTNQTSLIISFLTSFFFSIKTIFLPFPFSIILVKQPYVIEKYYEDLSKFTKRIIIINIYFSYFFIFILLYI